MGRRCPVLVGRDEELEVLRARWSAAAGGRGGVLFVCGGAGLGKSRLAQELAEGAERQGGNVVRGRAASLAAPYPYQPLIEVALQLTRDRALPADPVGPTGWPAVVGSMMTGAAGGDVGASPLLRREAFVRLLRWATTDQPLLVVLEDLHWADPDTLATVEYLGDNLGDVSALCVVTVRTGEPSAAAELVERGRARDVVGVDLGPLSDEGIEEMARVLAPEVGRADLDRIRRSCDGVPFFVEEMVAGPALPRSFTEGVRVRLAALDAASADVLLVAALLGRVVDWRLLSLAAGVTTEAVAAVIETARRAELLVSDADSVRFRHALTREAVLEAVAPPRRAMVAAAALEALDRGGVTDGHVGVAAELAVAAGDEERAGELLMRAAQRALTQGALGSAIDALTEAVARLAPGSARAHARAKLAEALALAGRAEEAAVEGRYAIDELEAHGVSTDGVHLHLAVAAADSARWDEVLDHIVGVQDMSMRPMALALEAEARYACGAFDPAVDLARSVIDDPAAPASARCHAWQLIGRGARMGDLDTARSAFEQAVSIAEGAGLVVWRLRALHELATIELLADAGTTRLLDARTAAQSLGVLSTVGWLDIQLAAASHLRFELDEAARYAREAEQLGARLGLSRVESMALWFRAENFALRGDRVRMEAALAEALAAAPGDPEMEGMAWAGARGMAALLAGEEDTALGLVGKGIARLPAVPQAPGHYRGMWPLLLAVAGDHRAAGALAEAKALGIDVNRINHGFLAIADAVLRGRRGDRSASGIVDRARLDLQRYPVWRDIALILAAEAALADGWGDPQAWAKDALDSLQGRGLEVWRARADALVTPLEERWSALGITAREAEVLHLVAAGLANKEVASRLSLSVRTVEKHVEAILRKTGCSTRTQLIAYVHR